MTDAREALRDKIIQRHLLNPGTELLDIAIDLVLEEAARCAEEHWWMADIHWWMHATKKEVSAKSAQEIAAAIRALPEKEKRTAAMDKLLETDGTLLRDE